MSRYEERTLCEAIYILENRTTIRQTAKFFNISKSTVHNDFQKRLQFINLSLYDKVKKLLDFNFSVKHERGGNTIKVRSNTKKVK